jgi:hypothetical protein
VRTHSLIESPLYREVVEDAGDGGRSARFARTAGRVGTDCGRIVATSPRDLW